jgi:hypothetical protein
MGDSYREGDDSLRCEISHCQILSALRQLTIKTKTKAPVAPEKNIVPEDSNRARRS